MLIKKRTGIEIPSSEITPEHVYHSRRTFIKSAAGLTAGALLAACTPGSRSEVMDEATAAPESTNATSATGAASVATSAPVTVEPAQVSAETDELGDPLNAFEEVINYNNYYEFTTDKAGVAALAAGYPTSPWQLEVGGLVNNPGIYDVDDLRQKFDQEERIYRLRCVEAWSMVIPWVGFPLSKLLQEVDDS
jgi:sulfoxide reductase catalytic subunit YedY